MTRNYNLPNIRELLMQGFSDRELRRLCFDVLAFRPVHEELAGHIGKAEIVDLLLEYAEQKELLDPLLDWVQEHNPAKYEKYQSNYLLSLSSIVTGSSRSCFQRSVDQGKHAQINLHENHSRSHYCSNHRLVRGRAIGLSLTEQ